MQRGLTLIELLVAIAVLAILLTAAVPGFRAFVENSRATAASNELATALALARSEAIKRGLSASVCPGDNGWDGGWRVLLGANCNAADNLRTWAESGEGISIASNRAVITFGALGGLETDPATISFTVPGCSGNRARQLDVGPAGAVSVITVACP